WTFWGGGRRRSNDRDNGNLQLIIFIIAIILAILAPIFATLMQLAISRKREFKADADGALLTRYPEGLIRALEKIDADPTPLTAANRATAHMYIISPLKGEDGKVGFFSKLFLTHPPTADRIAALRGMK
ncbi:MAG TPA: M48 family metalloprotease, partial [Candidatus Methylomirabilis sp.]|nr:M48 family metalloprotease [Candidatus Methylomirabilis sp.]